MKVAGGGAAVGAVARSSTAVEAQSVRSVAAERSDDLCFRSARDLAALIHGKKVSAREVMAAHLDRINRVNPSINAIVAKLDDDRCLALAAAADQIAAKGGPLGPLHGLPIAFKDLQPAVGFPHTRGSTVYRNAMPTEDSVLVERLRTAGAIPIGKTNTPEFGMGSLGPFVPEHAAAHGLRGQRTDGADRARYGLPPERDGRTRRSRSGKRPV